MFLAKDKNGRIGRKIPGVGYNSTVDCAQMGEHRGSLYLSTRSIEEDQAHYTQKEHQAKQLAHIKNAKRVQATIAKAKVENQRREKVKAFQKLAKKDPMNEKLKAYFAKRKGMGESELVAFDLLRNPADFSSSGGNPEIVPSSEGKRNIQWRADFRQHLIVGNPLTRDGQYGPEITDYDRYVNGIDVNQTDVVKIAGGTMLGRYDGSIAPMGTSGGFGDSQVQTERAEVASLAIASQEAIAKATLEQAELKSKRNAELIKYGLLGLGAILLIKALK